MVSVASRSRFSSYRPLLFLVDREKADSLGRECPAGLTGSASSPSRSPFSALPLNPTSAQHGVTWVCGGNVKWAVKWNASTGTRWKIARGPAQQRWDSTESRAGGRGAEGICECQVYTDSSGHDADGMLSCSNWETAWGKELSDQYTERSTGEQARQWPLSRSGPPICKRVN
jgi:hypothetical protein